LKNPVTSNILKHPSAPCYAYVVLAICFLNMLLVAGSQYCFGVLFKPMIVEFGWSRAATAGPFALSLIMSGVVSMAAGRLSDRLSPRFIVGFSSLIFGVGVILLSRITSLWQLYLIYGVVIGIGSGGMYTPLVTMLTRWFPSNRGLMAGIAISGIGFGIGVIPLFVSAMMESSSWRSAILIIGIIGLVLLTSSALFLKNPSSVTEAGLTASSRDSLSPTQEDYTFGRALHLRKFWLFFIAWLCYGFFFQVGLVHIIPYATDLGMPATSAAMVLTVIGLIGTAARIGLGFSGDRFGHKSIIFIAFGALALAYLGLTVNNSIWMVYVFAIFYGCFSGVGVLLAPVVAEYFGSRILGSVVGTLVMVNFFGGAVSPPLAGAIYDMTNSYQMAFLICCLLCLIAFIMIILLKPLTGSRIPQINASSK
jgi:MFS family permease